MGPINWAGIALAALVAAALGWLWYGRLFRSERPVPHLLALLVAMLLPAWLIGHNFARVGAETLAVKPWLYAMMSGGFALFFAVPALLLGLARHGVAMRERWIDAGYWLTALMAMGGVFWVLS